MDFERLIQQPESLRDDQWEQDFLSTFSSLKVQVEGDQAKQGPDGWPYLQVRTSPDGVEPVSDIIRWLASRGIGLVVNSHKMMPDYVFTYGMLWDFVETGRFVQPPKAANPAGEVIYSEAQKLIKGPPSEKYLPPYVRGVIRDFLRAQGFAAPKVLVISTADFSQVDLVFSVESLGHLPEKEHKVFAEMLGWFLPLHYHLVIAMSAGLPEFTAL